MQAAPTVLYLARHGQSEWNNQGLVTGQLDPGLSAKGLQQSEALAQCLHGETLAAIYASALQRTTATAQPTATRLGLGITQLAALNEIHMGVLQGRQRDDTDPEAQALWQQWQAAPWGPGVPGGESLAELTQRVDAVLQDLLQRHRGQRVLVVGHRATNRVLMGRLMGWPQERWPEIRLRNKFFYRIEPGADGAPARIATCTLSGSKTGSWIEGFVM
ncbi:Fructose-2,6-bisphosphatase [Rubrivivax sp. A210]|uniref:histidine phosphatase family protein n=1 Tax=Rubrivivax sp. A210 TaxID=2772301 RepID=UPI00191977B0|nr:histidine phosphatase family protein [Rubrivivax sp. A210]CAD5373928.1 Fructose-2,6-bisphosphatase [Rubrivivax sp. A210]